MASQKPARVEPHKVIAPERGVIYQGDCVAGMSRLQPGCAFSFCRPTIQHQLRI